jgi:glutathione S-transferase
MLKLYYAPYACSLSPHVALREAGIPFDLVRVDFARGKTLPDGSTFASVNPKGYVPALVLDDGQVLTEGAVMVQYIADLKPESHLAPKQGSFERVRLQEWLNFIATELHKGLGPLFAATANDEYKKVVRDKVASRLAFVAKSLEGKPYLLGDTFSVADGYVLYVLRAWQRVTKEDVPDGLGAYLARLQARPAVKAALEAEGLSPSAA